MKILYKKFKIRLKCISHIINNKLNVQYVDLIQKMNRKSWYFLYIMRKYVGTLAKRIGISVARTREIDFANNEIFKSRNEIFIRPYRGYMERKIHI